MDNTSNSDELEERTRLWGGHFREEGEEALPPTGLLMGISADFGPSLSLVDFAEYINDLNCAIQAGERVGALFAHRRLTGQTSLSGQRSDWLEQTVPMTLREVRYQNPLEVWITGGGLGLWGAVTVLRIVQTWHAERRRAAAAAEEAEARALNARNHAELLNWLVKEAQAGHLPLPLDQLITALDAQSMEAINRLSERPPALTFREDPEASGEA